MTNAKLEDSLDIHGWAKWLPDGMGMDWSTFLTLDQCSVCPDGYFPATVTMPPEAP